MKKSIFIFIVVAILLQQIIICYGNVEHQQSTTTIMTSTELYTPREIKLSLTEKTDEMKVTWITKGRINQPIVYLFKGDCNNIVFGYNTDNYKNINNNNQLLNVSTGKSIVYNGLQGYVHSVVIDSLEFGKTYCYSVGSGSLYRFGLGDRGINEPTKEADGKTGTDESDDSKAHYRWSNWIEFKTKPKEIDHVTFAAIADSGTWGDVHEVIKAMVKDESLSLAIHGGDLSYGLKEEVWDTFGDIIQPLASKMPFMVIPGNWDVKEGALLPYYNRYPMPLVYKQPTIEQKRIVKSDGTNQITLQSNPNLYYSFQYTHVYFIMLSSYDPYSIGSQQYNWLLSELELANTMRHIYPWVVVIAHSPMYSSSTGHGGSDTVVRTQLEWLYDTYRVSLVFSGHDHGYERTHPVFNERVLKRNINSQYLSSDGTIHILGGTGGANADPWIDEQPEWSAIRETSSGYTKFIAHKQTLQVTYLRIDGSIGDQFQITNKFPSLDSVKSSRKLNPSNLNRNNNNNNYSSPSEHTGLFLLFFALIIFVFPICAYYKIPNLIFNLLIPKSMMMNSNKSIV